MGYEVALAVLSNGAVEKLPIGAPRHTVLGSQGQILRSTCGAYNDCQLFWCLSSAYLTSQVNALCSFLSGQLIRGDAILTANLSSPGQAQGWINSVVRKSQALNAAGEHCHTVSIPQSSSTAMPSSEARSSRLNDSPAQSQDSFQAESDASAECQNAREEPRQVPHERPSANAADPEQAQASRKSQAVDLSSQQLPSAAELHAAHAVPNDDSEPRTRLLWSIVGQASSVTWNEAPVNSADPKCSAQSKGQIAVQPALGGKAHRHEEGSEALLLECKPCFIEPSNDLSCNALEANKANRASVGENLAWEDASLRSGRPPEWGWADLQPELLAIIAGNFKAASPLQSMVSACRQWREAIFDNSQLLQNVQFSELQSALPLMRQYSEGCACPISSGLPVTNLIDKAAKAGNLGACVAIASFLDRVGLHEEGMRYRRRAAKLGDPASQVMIGVAAYSGTYGVMKDGEEAYRWLSRAANRLAKLPFSLSTGHLLSKAALHLGFLALDGEATKLDLEGAVSWFRLASKCGSRDAEIALGTLLRTGQYGPS